MTKITIESGGNKATFKGDFSSYDDIYSIIRSLLEFLTFDSEGVIHHCWENRVRNDEV